MLADRMLISSPAPSGSSTSTTATPGGVERTARMWNSWRQATT
jgi:hypothetical protein